MTSPKRPAKPATPQDPNHTTDTDALRKEAERHWAASDAERAETEKKKADHPTPARPGNDTDLDVDTRE